MQAGIQLLVRILKRCQDSPLVVMAQPGHLRGNLIVAPQESQPMATPAGAAAKSRDRSVASAGDHIVTNIPIAAAAMIAAVAQPSHLSTGGLTR